MPLSLRTVEPVRLGKGLRCGSADDVSDPTVSTLIVSQSMANSILSRALLQLTSLVKHADGIFTNLSDECRKVYDRTNRINERIFTLTQCVENLNPKKEPIPSIDLKKFHKNSPPFDAKHGYECNLFTVESRPCSVKDLYSTADISPSEGLSALDGIRKDGWSGSTMFKLWPVANKDISISTPDFNSSRKNQPVQFQKTYKTLKAPQRSQTINSFDHLNSIEDGASDTDDLSDISKSQPSIVVSIDTSGASFERMCLYRRSLRDSINENSSVCTRRRSISGLPESIMNEIKNFEARKRNSRRFSSVPRRYPRTYSFNDLDPIHSKDEAFAKYFEEIEGKLDERNEWDNMMKQSFLSKIISCSKSQSSPHHQKSKFQKLSRTNSSTRKGASEDFDMKSLVQTNSDHVKQSRRKSSFIGDRIKSFMKIGGKPERKSLDLEFLKIPDGYYNSLDDAKLSLSKTISMPERICETAPEAPKTVEEDSSSCQFYNFSNNTLPRAQAKKYDFPWESLPKDWTTSVRLREISKRRKEERQSSSGNWSATSSARQSIESDQTNMTVATDRVVSSTASFCSLGQDSGRDSATETEYRRFSDTAECGGDEMSTFTGETSDRDSLNTELFKLDALVHRRNLMARTFNPDNTSSSSIESSNFYPKTDMSFYDPDMVLSCRQFKQDDEVSSLYSLDEDGFYTSFHSDSGLKAMRTMSKNRMSELSEIYSKFIGRSKRQTFSEATERNHIMEDICDQELEAEMREERDQTPTREMNPPRRLSSPTESETSDSTLTNTSNRNSLVTGASESNYSESDHEIIYKHIKNMTVISPKSFPSWCIVSSSGSDEDSSNQLHVGQKTGSDSSSSGSSLVAEATASDTKDSDDGGNTLPRNYLASEKWNVNQDKTGSWPRTRNSSNDGKKQGILKSSFRKDSSSKAKMPKSLNFSPYVNMLPADDLQTQHCLLSDLSVTNKHYSSLPEHNSFTSTSSASSTSSSTTICNDDTSTVVTMSDSDFDFLPRYPAPISSTTHQKCFTIEREPSTNAIHNETLVSCQKNNSLEPLTNSVIIRKPLAQLANNTTTTTTTTNNNNNIQFGAVNEETNVNAVMHNNSSLKQQLPSPDLSPPSSPYAVSFLPNAFTSFPSAKDHVSQNSTSFAFNKLDLQKLPVSETVVINTNNNNNNDNNNSNNNSQNNNNNIGLTVENSSKRLSFSTFTIPPSGQEASEKTSPTDNMLAGNLSKKLNLLPDTNQSDSVSDHSKPESSDSSSKYNPRNGSYRVAMYEQPEEEPKRLDSYRLAISASNKLTDDPVTRNGSYRVAVQDINQNNNNNNSNNIEPTSRSDSYRVAMKVEASDRRSKSLSKDIRRQGITDINQLKMDGNQQYDNYISSPVQKSTSFRSKMTSVFGGSKPDSQLLTKPQNSKKKYPKGNTYLSESTSLSTLKNLGKKSSSLPNQSTDLHTFKKLVSQQTPSSSPKTSAVEVLKRKPSPPFSKDVSSESSNRSILGGLFQRPSSWGGTSKVNPKMSTYVSFDTIFEDKEILSNASSIESLRSPSLTSIKKIGDPSNLHTVKFNHGLKADRKSLLEVNKHLSEEEQRNRKKRLAGTVDEKAVQSVLDSIKTTIKSMTSRSDSSYKQHSSAT